MREIEIGGCFRLKKTFWKIPAGTPCRILSIDATGITMEFAFTGDVILRNIARSVSFSEFAGLLKPARKTSFGPP